MHPNFLVNEKGKKNLQIMRAYTACILCEYDVKLEDAFAILWAK